MRARSQAWASRRVPDVLASPAGAASETCEPEAVGIRARPDLRPQIRRLLSDPRVTLAVLNVELLAKPGGVLDDLVAAGFDISGPAWKR